MIGSSGADIIYSDERELTDFEMINLNSKKNSIPVEYFRKNLFNATTRESKELRRLKTIYDDGENKVMVNRSLHQNHRDLLSILFTESKEIITQKDGALIIKTNLYQIAKHMGYKKPGDAIHLVKSYLYDLRNTEMTFKSKSENVVFDEKGGHRLIGEYEYNTKDGDYLIYIQAKTNKYKILNFAVEIPKKINRKIIAIPNKLAKTKALVSYILSNKALKNGISFTSVCDKLDITEVDNKSRFKRELKENADLLSDFNIYYDVETNIIKYEQLCDIKFHRAIDKSEILSKLENAEQLVEEVKEIPQQQLEAPNLQAKEIERYIGKYIKHKSNDVFGSDNVAISKIVEYQEQENDSNIIFYRLKIESNLEGTQITTKWLSLDDIKNIEERGFISEKEYF